MLGRRRPQRRWGRPALALVALTALTLAACGEEPITVPSEHRALIGTWEHGRLPVPEGDTPSVYAFVTITGDGKLSYAWYEHGGDGTSCTVVGAAELTHVGDDGLDARLFGPVTTELTITQRPRAEDGRMRMAIDGIELERVSPNVERTATGFACNDGTLEPPDGERPSGEPEGYDDAI